MGKGVRNNTIQENKINQIKFHEEIDQFIEQFKGVLTRTWAEGEASDVQAPFAGISYVVFGSWDLGKHLSSPT